jgi:bifunctional non-homologous end joining protein LigD
LHALPSFGNSIGGSKRSSAKEHGLVHNLLPTHRDLALLAPRPRLLSRADWLFELKWDGYRVLALRADRVRLISLRGSDLTDAFPEVRAELEKLAPDTALDGEVVMVGGDGRPLVDYLSRARGASTAGIGEGASARSAAFIAFDILFDGGLDSRAEPIEQRKERLVSRVLPGPHVRPIQPLEGEGEWLYAQADALGLEGVVAKRRRSSYRAGRTGDWLKIRTPLAAEGACRPAARAGTR